MIDIIGTFRHTKFKNYKTDRKYIQFLKIRSKRNKKPQNVQIKILDSDSFDSNSYSFYSRLSFDPLGKNMLMYEPLGPNNNQNKKIL